MTPIQFYFLLGVVGIGIFLGGIAMPTIAKRLRRPKSNRAKLVRPTEWYWNSDVENCDQGLGLAESDFPANTSPAVTGTLERVFFSLMIYFSIPGSGVAMIAWLAAKQLTNWQRRDPADDVAKPQGEIQAEDSYRLSLVRAANAREWAFSSLVLSLCNMAFALGGAIVALHWVRIEQLLPVLKTLRLSLGVVE